MLVGCFLRFLGVLIELIISIKCYFSQSNLYYYLSTNGKQPKQKEITELIEANKTEKLEVFEHTTYQVVFSDKETLKLELN